jgi:predicted exporter
MLVSSAFGALYSPLVVLRGFGLLTTDSVPLFIWGWFGGNVVAGLVFNFILLKILSPVVIRTTAFVKKWWA